MLSATVLPSPRERGFLPRGNGNLAEQWQYPRKDHQSHVIASRHIHTPQGFPAYLDKKGSLCVPSNEEIKLVCQIIHEAYEVSVNFLYMIVWSLNLPKKPWSLARGGMPLWNTNSTTETSKIQGRSGHAPPIMNHLPPRSPANSAWVSLYPK